MKMTVNQRLKIFANSYGFTQYRIAKDTGIAQPTINRFFTDKVEPNIQTLIKLLQAYPRLNPTWLLLGEGEMLLPEKVPLERKVSLEGVDKPKNNPVIPATVNNS